MKCPNCNQEPISFKKYLTKINNFTMKCQHCGTELKAGTLLSLIGTILTVSSFVIGFRIGLRISRWTPDDTVFVYIFIGLIIFSGLADFYTWKHGKYLIRRK